MLIFLIVIIFTLIYEISLFSLPFLLPYLSEGGAQTLGFVLIMMNITSQVPMVGCLVAGINYTHIYNLRNADATIALSKEKHRVKSLDEIVIEKCGNSIWKFYANGKTFEIDLKGYLFQRSYIMAIMVRIFYYRYIKIGKRKNFAKYVKAPMRSLKIQIKMPNNKVIKKNIVRHGRLCQNLISQAISHYQAVYAKFFNAQTELIGFILYLSNREKYTEEWWLRGA